MEVSLALLTSNYNTGTDLSCQCDLITICVNILTGKILHLFDFPKYLTVDEFSLLIKFQFCSFSFCPEDKCRKLNKKCENKRHSPNVTYHENHEYLLAHSNGETSSICIEISKI